MAMNNAFRRSIPAAAVVLIGMAAWQAVASVTSAARGDEEEEAVPMKQLPAPAAAAARDHFGSLDACKASKDGVDTFEIEGTTTAGKLSLRVTAAGDVIEEELLVDASRLSAAAKAQIAKAYPGAKVATVEAVTRRYFEVAVSVDGKRGSIEVDATGERIDHPAAVKAAAKKPAGESKEEDEDEEEGEEDEGDESGG